MGDLERLARGVLMPGFRGEWLPDWLVREHAAGLGAVCLYGENVSGPESLARLCADLREYLPGVLLAVDEEGGDVTRLHYPTGSPEPGNAVLGRLDDPAATRASAARTGRELAALGIGLDLAPVVDVNSAPENPVIGVRSFGADPEHVARHTTAYLSGLRDAGVAGCAKHFPGHGDTVVDSHVGLPRVSVAREVLEARELVPFAAAVSAGVACVMTSHLVVDALDPDRPATFSPAVLGVLRDELGFDGVVVSDALDMAGASAVTGIPEAAVRAVAAGCDLLCLGSGSSAELVAEVVRALVGAVSQGRLERTRLAEAAGRVAALRSAIVPGLASASPGADGADGIPALAAAVEVRPSARAWLDASAPVAVVQVGSDANLAVGDVAWGPAALGVAVAATDVAADAKVAVVGRGLGATHRAWEVADRLRQDGHEVLVVECGWPRPGMRAPDVVTYGGSPAVARALLHVLGVGPG